MNKTLKKLIDKIQDFLSHDINRWYGEGYAVPHEGSYAEGYAVSTGGCYVEGYAAPKISRIKEDKTTIGM